MNRRRGSGSRPRTERRGRPAGPPTTRLEVLPGQDFCRSRRSDAAAAKWRRRMTTKTWTAVTAATTVRVCLPPRPPGPIIQSPPGHGDHTIRLSCGPEKRQGKSSPYDIRTLFGEAYTHTPAFVDSQWLLDALSIADGFLVHANCCC